MLQLNVPNVVTVAIIAILSLAAFRVLTGMAAKRAGRADS